MPVRDVSPDPLNNLEQLRSRQSDRRSFEQLKVLLSARQVQPEPSSLHAINCTLEKMALQRHHGDVSVLSRYELE